MKLLILRWLATMLMRFLLSKGAKANEVVGQVKKAEQEHDNKMAQRGYVYRTIKAATGDVLPEHILNLIVELGVFVYKNSKK